MSTKGKLLPLLSIVFVATVLLGAASARIAKPKHKYLLRLTEPQGSQGMSFKGKSVRVQFQIKFRRIEFQITNKTDGPIKVDWNEVAYVDVMGQSRGSFIPAYDTWKRKKKWLLRLSLRERPCQICCIQRITFIMGSETS